MELSELEEPEKEKTVPRPAVVERTQTTETVELPKVSTPTTNAEQPKLFETVDKKEDSQASEGDHSQDVSNRSDKGEWL